MFNDTRVIPARLHGHKASGGRIEILVERLLDEQRALVHIRASKAPKPGGVLLLDAGFYCHRAGSPCRAFLKSVLNR